MFLKINNVNFLLNKSKSIQPYLPPKYYFVYAPGFYKRAKFLYIVDIITGVILGVEHVSPENMSGSQMF